MWSLYGLCALFIFIYMVTLYGISRIKKDNSIVDIGWGFGFVIIAAVSFFSNEQPDNRQWLILILVALWGIRLMLHLWIRAFGKGEDFRYVNFRKNWGKREPIIAFFRVFMLQGTIMLFLAYPIIRVHAVESVPFHFISYIGIAIWIIGYFFQVVGDAQLASFKKTRKHKEQVLTTGLWKYTRHPNYFGEAAMWWGIALIVLPVSGGWFALVTAAGINFLLLKVSGVRFLDIRYAHNETYQQYKKTTNRFIPWFPKNK